jgi:hypothetical protein
MHRSGTSSLAGSLQDAGLELGEVFTHGRDNRKGNRESFAIRELNDRLLHFNGGRWHSAPPSLRWNDQFRSQRSAVLDAYSSERRWGFKDPRTLLTLAFWQEGIPGLELVGTLRHPRAVAASLSRRDGRPLERGLALWAAYNERLLAALDREPFPLVSFDLPAAEYSSRVTAIAAALDLPRPPQFFDEALRHEVSDVEVPLPTAIDELYQRLRSYAERKG